MSKEKKTELSPFEKGIKIAEQRIERRKMRQACTFHRVNIATEVLRMTQWNSGDNQGWKDNGRISQQLTEAAEKVLIEYLGSGQL